MIFFVDNVQNIDLSVKHCYHANSMTQLQLQKKVMNLEAELSVLRTALQIEPNNLIDEDNWKKIKPTARSIRTKLYQQRYGQK